MFYLSASHRLGRNLMYQRTRFVGGPKLDTPTTAQRAEAIKANLRKLREAPKLEHDDIHNPYDFDDSERY
jgi:hypothetical protein